MTNTRPARKKKVFEVDFFKKSPARRRTEVDFFRKVYLSNSVPTCSNKLFEKSRLFFFPCGRGVNVCGSRRGACAARKIKYLA